MFSYKIIGLSLLLLAAHVAAEESPFKFEGILGSPVTNIDNMNSYAKSFIPYNPIIVEIGAYEGKGTLNLAQTYPYGRIYAFEPNPNAYNVLLENTQSFKNVSVLNMAVNTFNGYAALWGNDRKASLLPLQKKTTYIDVPCVSLDHWCEENLIQHIDFLRLDAGGLEWQILQSSPIILDTVLVIVTKTHMYPSRQSILSFTLLRRLLENEGFELIAHWYEEGNEGEATFIRKYIYDSLFR